MITTRTPFRISFLGGGSDFEKYYMHHEACVLSTTINKYCYVTTRPMLNVFGYKNQLTYSKIERFNSPDEINHPLIRAVMSRYELDHLQINYDSDLPGRSGLGSSSAFAVGVLNNIHTMRGEYVTKEQLAREAIYVERVLCGESGGIQDQIAAAYGGLNKIEFSDKGFNVKRLAVGKKRLDELCGRLMLFYTGSQRMSHEISREYECRIDDNTKFISQMVEFVNEGEKILLSECDIDGFGELLHRAWKIKQTLSPVISNSYINGIYDTAHKNGAIGGKILGAGGGGFMLIFAPPDRQEKIRAALPELQEISVGFEDSGTSVIYYGE